MKTRITALLKNNFIFIAASVLMLLLFCGIRISVDDSLTLNEAMGYNLKELILRICQDYQYQSSRIIVNGVIWFTLKYAVSVWPALNAIAFFVLFCALRELFTDERTVSGDLIIVSCTFMLPFIQLSSSGWMVATMTEVWPVIAGIVALIPIKRRINEEAISVPKMLLFCVAMIYACNFELVMAFLLGTYTVYTVYILIKRKKDISIFILWAISVLSAIFIVTTPGNHNRVDVATGHWFPDFGSLSLIDKIDLGLSSTLRQIVFGNTALWALLCLLIMIVIWKRDKELSGRIFSAIPFTAVLLGLFGEKLSQNAYSLTEEVPRTGTINVFESWDISALIKLTIYLLITFLVSYFICEITVYKKQLFYTIIPLVFSVLGRMTLGFSPTVWASDLRTFFAVYILLLGMVIVINDIMRKQKLFAGNKISILYALMIVAGAINYIDSFLYIYNS